MKYALQRQNDCVFLNLFWLDWRILDVWELNLKGEEEPGEELDYERSKKVMEVRTMRGRDELSCELQSCL